MNLSVKTAPAPLFADSTAILPNYLLPPAAYYATIMAYGHAAIDSAMHFDKRRKSNHRYTITDTQGELTLTIPIEKPKSMSAAGWNDIVISDHAHWWNVHFQALQSAYGRTPFYEFYIDRFAPLLNSCAPGMKLMEYNTALHRIVIDILGLSTNVEFKTPQDSLIAPVIDFRHHSAEFIAQVEYYQIWASKHGFRPGMSILDLIFNMGPEAPVVLARMCGIVKSY